MTSVNSSHYKEHVEIMKGLQMAESFHEVREPYKEGFEKIYNQAKEEGVTISSAKEFLNSLSQDELSTLQNFTLLVDEINVDELSDEGAYNLLLHHYEKYDFNGDGFREDGISKGAGFIPEELPSDAKKAMVDTFNELGPENMLMASVLFIKLPKIVNGQVVPNNEPLTLEQVQQRIDAIFDPKNKNNSTAEFKELISNFWELFNSNHDKIKEQKAYYGISS